MLEGIQEGQTDNAKNHRFMDWDIYDASGSDWIPSNIISNPYLSGVRGLILLKQWRAEGLSESQIQERFLKDNILGAFGSGPDINEIVHQVRNGGLSVDDALRLATLTVYGKVTDNASKGKNVTGKETDANKPLDKTDLELQHGKGNVEQGGGNYKETKDKILDNQDTNQKANESSNFGEHVKKEQEINAGKGTGGSLTGKPTQLPHSSSSDNIRSIMRENESAQILANNGYHVEQNPIIPGLKKPDYKINGEIFDNIAPKTNSVRNIYDRALEKINAGQTKSVVINLADTKVSVDDLQKQFNDWPMKGLDKVIVIDQSGKPTRIK
ncbi:hypothetical protein J3U57_12445 [Gilliamella sp. B3464]|uniref:CdiA C-terminal domain-containing protein n=1 Tax=Gilliamella sp. B3464 TaxID=2818022 RepID=UPI00226AE550|nr:hypothetical protein [Gilliamella sp. B3464]MCX8752382.1 hypothetical protein [Gilliamella sp. B3464]